MNDISCTSGWNSTKFSSDGALILPSFVKISKRVSEILGGVNFYNEIYKGT